ncbi:hypothetical protein FHW89_001968 [Mucilaginibacter sp. SG564]|nr:hypothetical protein [Mucilaginibacter sp. SG564]
MDFNIFLIKNGQKTFRNEPKNIDDIAFNKFRYGFEPF